ncbi:DUF1934 domain-containing protein [Caproiciproducens sp. LBM24188]|nr:DUF1934 domain-containing protein [Oscillospiraceae bacterium]HHV30798.1 DUF1934 domain-containing protein [Clostridiales bacterium]
MQEDYLISIRGKQNVNGERGEVEITTMGSYVKKGNSRYIVYKEYDTENHNAAHTSVLKIDGDSKVTLIRGGEQSTRLILESGKRHVCPYDTGYGCMMIGIFTNKVKSKLDDLGGSLEINYTLDINSNLSSLNEVFITVKEAKNKDVKTSIQGDQ